MPKADLGAALAAHAETQTKAYKAKGNSSNPSDDKDREAVKAAILAQYGNSVVEESDEEEEDDDEHDLGSNTNAEAVAKAQQDQRERSKVASQAKKDKDKDVSICSDLFSLLRDIFPWVNLIYLCGNFSAHNPQLESLMLCLKGTQRLCQR